MRGQSRMRPTGRLNGLMRPAFGITSALTGYVLPVNAVGLQARRADGVAMARSLEQPLMFLVGGGLGAIGQHDQMVIRHPVDPPQPRVVQDALVIEVQQALLV